MLSKHKILLLIGIALFLIVGIGFHFRAFFLISVIEPIALIIWTFWMLISSIDQRLCWGAVIALCVMVTFRLIPSSEPKLQNQVYAYEFRPQSQMDYWRGILGQGDHDILRGDLKNLLLKVLATSNKYQALESDEINIASTLLPVKTQEYLNNTGKRWSRSNWHSRQTFLSSLFLSVGRKKTKKELDIINEVVQWMETELDINYEK